MNKKELKTNSIVVLLLFASTTFLCVAANAAGSGSSGAGSVAEQSLTDKQTYEAERMRQMREKADAEKRKAAELDKMFAAEQKKAKDAAVIEKLVLPEDTSARLNVKEIQISGNTLVSTADLITEMPLVFNASQKPLLEAAPQDLYDLRPINEILTLPGEKREVSLRTIQGFTQYILSAYQDRKHAGIYVYVPKEALTDGKLVNDVLSVRVIEASISSVRITAYDVNQNQRDKPILKREILEEWSPVKTGSVLNGKKLNDFIELLNLNPDRYISATVSRGAEPNSLAVGYDLYETSPWHAYIQVDNSGTPDRRYKPRLGLINTDLTGRDDRLTLYAQIAPEHGFEDNYAVYGSYEVPLWTPRLRLGIFGGRSEFDTLAPGDISFLGHGTFYGGTLRFNVLQHNKWFFDVIGSLSDERSKITPSLFPSVLGSDLRWLLWSAGAELHHRDDMLQSNIAFNQYWSSDESSQGEFEKARSGSRPDFVIYNLSAIHSQFLDPYKVNRISGSIKWIDSNHRLAPARMTTFGGLYTARGYKEDQIVADGGLLFSVQYEYDLVKMSEKEQRKANLADVNEPAKPQEKEWLKRLAPLCFIDGGRAMIKDHLAGEKAAEDLLSIGIGLIGEVTEHYQAAVYIGWPLKDAGNTEKGHERLNFSFIARW